MARRLVVLLLLLWLPLQGLAALTMPFCRHALDSDLLHSVQEAAPAGHSHHEHGAPAPVSHGVDHAGSLACNDCGACHLACAAVLLPKVGGSVVILASGKVSLPPPLAPPALVLEQPNPPPLSRG
jgi:hypothetical protein